MVFLGKDIQHLASKVRGSNDPDNLIGNVHSNNPCFSDNDHKALEDVLPIETFQDLKNYQRKYYHEPA